MRLDLIPRVDGGCRGVPAVIEQADATLFADVWQECHEPRPFDGFGYRVLAGRRAPGFATSHDFAVPID